LIFVKNAEEKSMDFRMSLLKLFSIYFLGLLVSCVGTVTDNQQKINPAEIISPTTIYFDGVIRGTVTAHNKVSLFFTPARGGSGNFNYLVYVNGNDTPTASLNGSTATLNGRGEHNISVGGLTIGTSYSFKIKAYDRTHRVEDRNTSEVVLTTLNYMVPLFDGVNVVENIAGLDGETKLLARWNPAVEAATNSNPFSINAQAISGYNIYVGTSEESLQLVGSTGANQLQFEISGLEPGTNYFVLVRAKNSQVPQREDLNDRLLEKKTVTSSAIAFDGIKSLTVPTNASGFSSVVAQWDGGAGSYDRYWVFVSDTPRSLFDPSLSSDIANFRKAVVTNLSTVSLTLSVSLPHTTYYVAVVACRDSVCSTYKGHNVVRSVRTTPPVAVFGGLNALTQPEGLLGLTSLDLTWDVPDTSTGVYDRIRLFRSNEAGAYTPATDELPIYNPANPSVVGYDLASLTLGSVRVRGLVPGTEYCFVAKAYSTSPSDPSDASGLGRTSGGDKRLCFTPTMVMPGFSGINSACTEASPTSFKVTWSTPNPRGIFENFALWYKPLDGQAFDFNLALLGAPYQVGFAPTNANSLVLTNLSPGTSYAIGMRTYVSVPPYYDSNIMVAYCQTEQARVSHNGWLEIMAVGPKINGVTVPPSVIKESIPTSVVDTNVTYTNRYVKENPFGVTRTEASPDETINASTDGIVRLVWRDFNLSGTIGKLSDYPGAENGYRVYRKRWMPSHASVPPTIGDLDWGAPVNSSLIAPSFAAMKIGSTTSSVFYAEFIDYTVDRSDVSPTSTKVYWYKVEAVLNGGVIPFENNSVDSIVKVTLPPPNMALVHRWMANKDFCDTIQRTPDRANNYRCDYNGLGSRGGYYDIGNDYLMDRFELGCNFSRAACTNVSMGADFEGTGANGTLANDCIGYGTPNTKVSAAPGTVFYDRSVAQACWINTSSGAAGSTWTRFTNLNSSFENYLTLDNSTTLPPYNASSYPGGRGYGGLMVTNNAKMPVFVGANILAMERICLNFSITHQNVTGKKRLMRQEEYLRASTLSPFMANDTTRNGLINGTLQTSTSSASSHLNDNQLQTGPIQRDCLSNNSNHGGLNTINYLDNRYSAAEYLGEKNDRISSPSGAIQNFISGSANDAINRSSTEACQSRYGIQDLQGNLWEGIGMTLNCNTTSGNEGCSVLWEDPVTETTPFTPTVGSDSINFLLNGNGKGLNWRHLQPSNSQQDAFSRVPAECIFSSKINFSGYVSIATGFPLQCTGGACQDGDGNDDDNFRVSTTTASTTPKAAVTNFNLGGSPTISFCTGDSSSLSGERAISAGGATSTSAWAPASSPYSFFIKPLNISPGAMRCTYPLNN
jgi:hypothetical protein